MTPAERIALYVRLDKALREESSDVIEPGDGEQADPAGATFPGSGRESGLAAWATATERKTIERLSHTQAVAQQSPTD
jgi:hypothetical protein